MGVSSQILVHKPRQGVHKAGKSVTGVVKYYIDEPTDYKEVTLSFHGKAKCRWTENSGKHSTTYEGNEEIINHQVNITNKKPQEIITLQPGAYEYPFQFYLPEDIPSSYKDSTGSIIYKIKLKFVKPEIFSFKREFTAEIIVYGTVKSKAPSGVPDGPVIFGLEKQLFAPFSAETPVVNLKAEIAKSCLLPGENVQLCYEVTNRTNVIIPSIKVGLFCHTTYTADCGRTKIKEKQFDECQWESSEVTQKITPKVTVVLPTLAKLYSIQYCSVILKEYRVRITVRLPLPHFNAKVEMPIALGEKINSGGVDLCDYTLEDIEVATDPMNDGEASAPPSYWQAMNEEKEEHKTTNKK